MGLDFVGEEHFGHTIQLDERLSVLCHAVSPPAGLKACATAIASAGLKCLTLKACTTDFGAGPSGPRSRYFNRIRSYASYADMSDRIT